MAAALDVTAGRADAGAVAGNHDIAVSFESLLSFESHHSGAHLEGRSLVPPVIPVEDLVVLEVCNSNSKAAMAN